MPSRVSMAHRPVRETTEMVVGALGRPHTHPLAQHHHGWSGTKDVPALKEPVLVECNWKCEKSTSHWIWAGGFFEGLEIWALFFFPTLCIFFFSKSRNGNESALKSAVEAPKMKFWLESTVGTFRKGFRILHLKCFWSDRKKFGAKFRAFSVKFEVFSRFFF